MIFRGLKKKIIRFLKDYQRKKFEFYQSMHKSNIQPEKPTGTETGKKQKKGSETTKKQLKIRKSYKSGNKSQKKYIIIFVMIHIINIILVGGFFIYLVFWLKSKGVF